MTIERASLRDPRLYFGAFPITLTELCLECGGDGDLNAVYPDELFAPPDPCSNCTDGRVPIGGE